MSSSAEPTPKRRKLDSDTPPHRATVSLENTVTQDNARAHFGDCHTQNTIGQVYITSNPAPAAVEDEDESRHAETLMEALAFEQMDARLETISKAHAKTCQWLFAREEYKKWRSPTAMDEHHGFFWIKGNPGTGKSTLMKCAKQHGENNYEDLVISFFFNARGEELEMSVEGMYRSLLYQLLDKKPELSFIVARHKKRAHQQNWSIEVLKEMFETAVRSLGDTKVTCYVDALDECDDEQAKEMIESFEEFGQSAVEGNINFRVLLSSRHYPYITIDKHIGMTLEGQEGHEADIADYVRSKLKIGTSKLAMETRDAIRVRASGVFLWVVLVIRILNDCDSRGKTHLLRKRLEAIPDGLSKLFEEILQRRTQDLDDTLLTYQWILFARRPLKREELYFAVATNFEDDDIHDWNQEEITTDVMDRYILNSSKGLAQMTRGKHPTVQFIHESVREYLLDTGLQKLKSDLYENLSQVSHDALWRCCHHYLQKIKAALLPTDRDGVKEYMSQKPRDISALRARSAATHPFLDYAVAGIFYHANLASTEQLDYFTATFPHELWQRLYNLTCQYHPRRMTQISPMAYKCILMNAHEAAVSEIRRKPSLATECYPEEFHPSLLAIATVNRDLEIIKMLLRFGADPHGTATSTSKFDCLAHAIEKKDASTVETLLDGGADLRRELTIRARTHYCWSYLQLASEHYNMDVIKTIFSHEPYREPLYWPREFTRALEKARSRSDSMLEQMLHTRLDLIYTDLATSTNGPVPGHYVNAFVAACYCGDVRLITRFMSRDVSSLDLFLYDAVIEAVSQNHVEAFLALIDHGVEVDLPALLLVAARKGSLGIVRLLIQSGVNIDYSPNSSWTALHWAIDHGHLDVVEILLELGADPNIMVHRPHDFNGNSLHFAARCGRPEILRMLLQHPGMAVNVLNGDGNHAIAMAARYAQDSCVQVLLETDIPVEYLQKALQMNTGNNWMEDWAEERERIQSMLIARGARLSGTTNGRAS